MGEITESTTTPKPDLETIRKQMRSLSNSWAKDLVAQMKADDTIPAHKVGDINLQKIYNVFNGVVRDPWWQMEILAQGKKLIHDLNTRFNKAV